MLLGLCLLIPVTGCSVVRPDASDPLPALEFNFRNVPLREVLHYISEQTGVKFRFHAKVKGREDELVDAMSREPIEQYERYKLWSILNDVLGQLTMSAYPRDGVVCILLADTCKSVRNLQVGSDPEEVEDSNKQLTQIVPLDGALWQSAKTHLQEHYSRELDIHFDEINGFVILRGASRLIRRFLLALGRF